jgi:glycosyltransferase involved in cell wall biosynthesis
MAYNHTRSLVAAGHAVDVFTPAYDGNERTEEREGFRIHYVKPLVQFGNAGFIPQITQKLEKYDIVHLHYPFYGAAEPLWRLKKRKGDALKLVLTYHMDVVGGMFLKPFFMLHTRFIMPRIVKSADAVIVTSNDYAAHSNIAKLFYRIPEKFHEIPPEVDTHHFYHREDTHALRERHGIQEDERVLLFVGGLDKAHYFKGIDFLIDAFEVVQRSTVHKVKLLIVGKGELSTDYQRKVKEKGLDSSIIFVGPASYEDLPRYYSLADVTLLPSIDKSEAFGIVLIESLACQTPIIATSLPGVRTVVDQDVNGYTFALKNEGQLAGAVHDILTSPEKARAMGLKGREKVEQLYAKEKVVHKLSEVYRSI